VAPGSVAAFGPVATASTPETTQLAPEEQAAFEQWLRANNIHDLDDPRSHYDYRGAFKAGVGREPGAEGHFPDTFKQHGHETFSNESQYSKGDGGSWNGDTFIPKSAGMRPSAAEPGAKGPLGPLGAAPPKVNAPYGMRPGVRHLLPGLPPPRVDRTGDFDLVAPSGAVIPIRDLNPRDNDIVDKLGQAFVNGSGDDRERRVANQALQAGRALVGQMPIQEIQKIMTDMWDHGVGNVLKRDLGRDRIAAAAANRGLRNPNLPGKADEASATNAFKMAEAVAGRESRVTKLAAANEMLSQFDRVDALISSDKPMAERIAPMVILLGLTGKASVESERAGVTKGAGEWDYWANKFKQLDPNDPGMTRAYVEEVKRYLQTERNAVIERRKAIATAAANDVLEAVEPVYGPEVAKQQARRIYSATMGEFKNARFNPDTDPGNDPTEPLPRPGMAPKAAAPRAAAPRAAAAAPRATAPTPKAAAPAPAAGGVRSILDKLRAKK
jgi:hypothetical protein